MSTTEFEILVCATCHHQETAPFAPGDRCPMCEGKLEELPPFDREDARLSGQNAPDDEPAAATASPQAELPPSPAPEVAQAPSAPGTRETPPSPSGPLSIPSCEPNRLGGEKPEAGLVEKLAQALHHNDAGLTDEDYQVINAKPRKAWGSFEHDHYADPQSLHQLQEWERDGFRHMARAALDFLVAAKAGTPQPDTELSKLVEELDREERPPLLPPNEACPHGNPGACQRCDLADVAEALERALRADTWPECLSAIHFALELLEPPTAETKPDEKDPTT